MAAYAALVSLMNDLELIPNHPTHSFSFDNNQIASLSQIVNFLIDFMVSYDTDGCGRESAEVLESRIASAAHDVVESHVVDQIHAGTTLGGKARCYFLLDLQKAIANMDFVKRKAMQFQAKSGLKATYSPPPASSEPPTTSEKNVMVGFDAVVVRLLEMLTGEPSSHRVIPVVGMAGIGKTTLARSAYDHLNIQHHFDVRLWATISQQYSLENILRELLSKERNSTSGNVSGLGVELHKKLWGRRYLIVLDDMWSVVAWEEIQNFLPHNDNGSCVIVTSRLSNMARRLSASPFEMNFLDDDRSWELFCGKAFGGEEDCPVELEEIGKKIVKRCRGLPLSIVVIGGHLRRSSRAIQYWEKVANFMNPISRIGADDQCLKILSLSYEHLPACLKPCFLYLGIFKEDARIDASRLLKYWVGEGFVRPNKSQSLEEVAEDYLKDLIDRNLILVRKRRWNGKAEECGIHDVVRELCLKIGKKEKFMRVVEDTTEVIGRERRIVIPYHCSDMIGALRSAPLLRSLICRGGVEFVNDGLSVDFRSLICRGGVEFVNDGLSVDFRLLRIAKIVDKDFLPSKFQQINLRYLALYDGNSTVIAHLPSSISLFWNMQTLIFNDFSVMTVLPYEIWKMSQLRNLQSIFSRLRLPDPLPGDTSNQQKCVVLRNLQTLALVKNLRLTEEVCKRMPNIKHLSLYNEGDCEGSSYYCLHNLGRLNKLESLECTFDVDSKWRNVFLSFILPSSLEELILWNCHWEDLTKVIKSLPRLGFLELWQVEGPEWDLAEEKFTSLKILRIEKCDGLKYWNADSSHFPVLENLYITDAPQLSEIPCDIGEIPTLRRIQLFDCSVSAAVSAMRIVVEQESLGNEDLLLDVHFRFQMEEERIREMVQEECLTSNSIRVWNNEKEIKLRPSQL